MLNTDLGSGHGTHCAGTVGGTGQASQGKYRGAAPIQWAILDGESETGVTLMKMDAGLDTGAPLDTNIFTDALNIGVTLLGVLGSGVLTALFGWGWLVS